DLGTPPPGHLGEGVARLGRGPVCDEPDWIDRLSRPFSADDDPDPGPVPDSPTYPNGRGRPMRPSSPNDPTSPTSPNPDLGLGQHSEHRLHDPRRVSKAPRTGV